MEGTAAIPDFLGAVKEYNDTRGMKDVSYASVASHFPGVSRTSLQRRVSGEVEVNGKMGRPPSLTPGDKVAVRAWIGEGARTSDCRTPTQFGARLAQIASTNGTPYADGTPSLRPRILQGQHSYQASLRYQFSLPWC